MSKMGEEMSYFISKQLRSLFQQLRHRNNSLCAGYLHGFSLASECYLISCSGLSNDEKPGSFYDAVTQSLPAGIQIRGLYIITEKASDVAYIENKCKHELSGLIKMLPEETPCLLLSVDVNQSTDDVLLYEYNTESLTLTPVACSSTDTDILSSCITARLQANLRIVMEYTNNKESLRNGLFGEIENWKEELLCQTTAFHIDSSDVLLFTGEVAQEVDYTYSDIVELIQRACDEDDGFGSKTKKKKSNYSNEVIHLRLLCQRSTDVASQSSMSYAPIIHHKHGPFMHMEINLPIDIVAYLHPDMTPVYLADNLVMSICHQLNALYAVMASSKKDSFSTAVPYHFKPDTLGHIITIIYPLDKTDQQLESYRKRYHAVYHLANDIPEVRRLNAFLFPDEQLAGGYLINPHIGLPTSGVNGGCVSLVRGQYTYHHYMQDHMDDSGWGCAYRSLQTLISWFRLQGYTDKPIPSHREIQQILIDIGDKEKKFLDSKQWIGSTEVSYVLDHLLEVSCKILFVSSGAELGSKGRELAVHFDTQGTPVMIGGGVLAHTILGIDFNEVTGDVKFLVLDPHYTGGEDLKTIQNKGWCGWKGTDFWDKNAYYNLCMPQRPLTI